MYRYLCTKCTAAMPSAAQWHWHNSTFRCLAPVTTPLRNVTGGGHLAASLTEIQSLQLEPPSRHLIMNLPIPLPRSIITSANSACGPCQVQRCRTSRCGQYILLVCTSPLLSLLRRTRTWSPVLVICTSGMTEYIVTLTADRIPVSSSRKPSIPSYLLHIKHFEAVQ